MSPGLNLKLISHKRKWDVAVLRSLAESPILFVSSHYGDNVGSERLPISDQTQTDVRCNLVVAAVRHE
jgi:hypothetical protein